MLKLSCYYHLLYYLKRWVLKKKKKREIRGNRKEQVLGTSKEKKKSETRGKNRQVSDSRIRGTRYPPERKEKYRASHSPHKVSESKEGMYPLKRAKVELDFHRHHHTPFIRHACTSWLNLLTCFFGSMVWLCNKCLLSMYILSPTYELQILKPYYSRVREKAISLCLIPQILHILREGIYHHYLGKDPEIPQKRDLRESYKESLSFIWKSAKNFRAIADQE